MMKEIECPECGAMIPSDSKYCDQCGVELLECVNCGSVGTGNFCAMCSSPMVSRNPDKPATVTTTTASPTADDVHKTGGVARKSLALKARQGNFVIIPRDEAVIGRGEGDYVAQLSKCEYISRRHGKFVKQGRLWLIVDFGSTNGTLVNDKELQPDIPVQFRKGDVIDIGTYIFDVVEQ